jgi:hypothetical protein
MDSNFRFRASSDYAGVNAIRNGLAAEPRCSRCSAGRVIQIDDLDAKNRVIAANGVGEWEGFDGVAQDPERYCGVLFPGALRHAQQGNIAAPESRCRIISDDIALP